MNKVNDDLSPLVKTPGLDSNLDNLKALLDRLTLEYNAKKNAGENSNNAGQKERHPIHCYTQF